MKTDIYIGICKSEVIHKSIEALCEAYRSNPKANTNVKRILDHTSDRPKMKALLKEGYVTAFREILGKYGEHLKQEVDTILADCYHVSTSLMKPKPDWDNVYKIAALYGLDSTDAMLLNFAITQSTFSGLISMDADFRFCSDVEDFDIILPDQIKNNNPAMPI